MRLQDSLSKMSSIIWKQNSDSARLKANDLFYNTFLSVLKSGSSTNAVFDSIKGITTAKSDDGKLIIYTWNVPLSNGENKYFGFLRYANDSSKLIPLRSVNTNVPDFDAQVIPVSDWYGALYYKIIDVKVGKASAYTLLGWDAYTTSSNRKMIDILSFDKNGIMVFGMPVFKTDHGLKCRVVKEYAEKATMLLRYDYQAILIKKGKRVKKENTWLIVMDRLIPMDPSMKGFPKFYVAAGDTYEGYVFRDGYWLFVDDVDVVNRFVKP